MIPNKMKIWRKEKNKQNLTMKIKIKNIVSKENITAKDVASPEVRERQRPPAKRTSSSA